MALPSGARLGPYQIVTALGAGGMGEVYRARDMRLGREVALKVLPQHLTASPEDRARFKREAKTISSLNHPNICALYDVGLEGDTDYLIMELIEGETLAQRLSRGALPGAEVLKLGSQIADALDRAHRAGVVHRDLKPGNVMLTKGGAKLMDFGLARATGRARSPAGSGATAVASGGSEEPITGKGMVVGTVQYMAPEQLEGKRVDGRSDLWALGCVLYEMSTGKRAFEGTTTASLISAIMRDEPRGMSELAPMTPPSLERLVRGCLVKDPEERVQTAHDAKLQLQWIVEEGSQGGVAAPVAARRRGRVRLVWGWAAAATVAAALLAIDHFANTPTKLDPIRIQISVPRGLIDVGPPTVSPNGQYVAFSATDSMMVSRVWIRPMNSLTVRPVPGTEGAGRPFWSPDSRSLAFFVLGGGGKLKTVTVAGGPPQTISSTFGGDGSWGKGGVIVFDEFGAGIGRVSAAGGAPTAATTSGTWPQFLPNGREFLYLSGSGVPSSEGTLEIKGLDSKTSSTVATGDFSRVAYAPPGHLLFVRDQVLVAQAFDSRRQKLTEEPISIVGDVGSGGAQHADFSVSGNGVLAFREVGLDSTRLIWVDRTGRELVTVARLGGLSEFSVSPSGSRVAFWKGGDIWVVERSRGVESRLTFDPGIEFTPVWFPDGDRILFGSSRGDTGAIYQTRSSGAGDEELVLKPSLPMGPSDCSMDEQYIVLLAATKETGSDIWVLRTVGKREPKLYLRRPRAFDLGDARLSPDSRWMAYSSKESGRREVYVQAFPEPGKRWQVSATGGRDPQWRNDGKEMFFLANSGAVMSVAVTTTPTFHVGEPKPLFAAMRPIEVRDGGVGRVYAATADGQHFIVQKFVMGPSPPISVVLNWDSAIRRK